MKPAGWLRPILHAAAASVVVNAYLVYAAWESVSPGGSGGHLSIAVYLLAPMVLALLLLALCALGLLTRLRTLFAKLGAGAIVYVVVGVLLARAGAEVRMRGFHELAERSRPLVAAIHAYSATHGAPPASLADLVPGFLAEVPGTGLGAYPEYRYQVDADGGRFDGNPWALVVDTPSGGLNWDVFLYLPLGNYPPTGYGGVLERVGEWAYVHE